jgi:uncharacterized protein YlzI (FlbEa/FlbD family)
MSAIIMLKLTGAEGEPIWINPGLVSYITPDKDGAKIVLAAGASVDVRECAEAIVKALLHSDSIVQHPQPQTAAVARN